MCYQLCTTYYVLPTAGLNAETQTMVPFVAPALPVTRVTVASANVMLAVKILVILVSCRVLSQKYAIMGT